MKRTLSKIKVLSVLALLMFSAILSVAITPFLAIATGIIFGVITVALFLGSIALPTGVLGLNSFDLLKVTVENPGGCSTEWYWCFWDDVLTFPTLPAIDAIGDPDTKALLTGTHIMKTGKQFWRGYGTLDTVSIEDDAVGPLDSKSFKNTFKCDHPGIKALLAGWLRMVQNRSLIIIVKDSAGILRVVGNQNYGANLTEAKATTGAKVEDGNKASLAFESYGPCPAPILPAVVSLTPAL